MIAIETIVVADVAQKEFPCNSCGAKLEFNPLEGGLACPYCGHTEAIQEDDIDAQERAFDQHSLSDSLEMARLSEESLEVACPSCRARVVFEPPEVAGNCPFCGTGIVGEGKPSKPVAKADGVLPCKVTRKEANQFFRKWLSGNWFLVSDLGKLAQAESFQGIYLPYWTFDTKTFTAFSGEQGVREYYERRDGSSDYRTRWIPVSGNFETSFDDMLVPASKQLSQKRLKQLKGWDLDDVVTYTPSFLSGFKVQRYQVPLDKAWEISKSEIETYLRRDAKSEIGGDEQRLNEVHPEYFDITYKHILLPLWMSSFHYKKKKYQVIVNGQTGEVIGDRPYSKSKIGAAIAAGTLVAGMLLTMIVDVGSNMQPSSSVTRDRSSPSSVIRRRRSTPSFSGGSTSTTKPRQKSYSPNKGSGSSIRRSRKKSKSRKSRRR